jgi:hypothetical protein
MDFVVWVRELKLKLIILAKPLMVPAVGIAMREQASK